jgi:glucose-6-phosphate 1-dehydrogenase
VPPQHYEMIFDHLHNSEVLALCDGESSWARLLVEKPFGRDLTTARVLEQKLCSLFGDEQIYRIDHYLAKDAIENIVALRFVNTVLADSWDGKAIESIAIKLLETKDVSNRGSFYDTIGTLRDVGQNHMLQIFALLTMPPADIQDAQAIRAARTNALQALMSQVSTNVVRGHYDGYTEADGVADKSDTETYFKLSFTLDAAPWQDTTFTLEAGKALQEHINEAVITFRPRTPCHCAAQTEPHEHRNVLRIQFAPEQRIDISMWTKAPGFAFALREQQLTLVSNAGEDVASPEAYERVLFDCITGDQTRFVSGDEVELAWQFITPILEQFKTLPLYPYAPGSPGPVVE